MLRAHETTCVMRRSAVSSIREGERERLAGVSTSGRKLQAFAPSFWGYICVTWDYIGGYIGVI